MTFFQSLFQTYEANADRVGKVELKYVRGQAIPFMLLPVSHMTQTAHIEVRLTRSGEWIEAVVLPKVNTVIPFTEQSGMRAGKSFMPHMLHDKLMYVAGDMIRTRAKRKRKVLTGISSSLPIGVNSQIVRPKFMRFMRMCKRHGSSKI